MGIIFLITLVSCLYEPHDGGGLKSVLSRENMERSFCKSTEETEQFGHDVTRRNLILMTYYPRIFISQKIRTLFAVEPKMNFMPGTRQNLKQGVKSIKS